MDIEIQKQLAEYDRNHLTELDALILWELHEQLGFGFKRLKRFNKRFAPSLEDLIKRYEMDDSDRVWLCTRRLKEIGIDVEKWSNERGEANEQSKSQKERRGVF